MGFGIDEDENIERIAETTGLNTDSIEKLRDSFSEKFLSEGHSAFKLQYLAHLVRSMESYIRRELEDHRFFRIELQPFRDDDPNLGVASAQRSPTNTYIIYYHPAMDPKQLRICLAHELGHLFLCILADKKPEEYRSRGACALGRFSRNDEPDGRGSQQFLTDFTHLNLSGWFRACTLRWGHPFPDSGSLRLNWNRSKEQLEDMHCHSCRMIGTDTSIN